MKNLEIRILPVNPGYKFLTFQVGRYEDEHLLVPARPGLHDAIDEPVRRFRLIGFGATRKAAMAMAEKMNGGATES